jgi:hypothetical protein
MLIAILWKYNNVLEQKNKLDDQQKQVQQLAIHSQQAMAVIQLNKVAFSHFQRIQFEDEVTSEAIKKDKDCKIVTGIAKQLRVPGSDIALHNHFISFSIAGLQDRTLFELVENLILKGPGIFKISEIIISRPGKLDNDMLEKIANGQSFNFIEGQVTGTWIHR